MNILCQRTCFSLSLFPNSCLTDLSAGPPSTAALRIIFKYCKVQCSTLYVCLIPLPAAEASVWITISVSCSSFLLSSPQSEIWPSTLCDSSQMAVAEPHRWSYLQRTPHQRHTDGSVHLPCFSNQGAAAKPHHNFLPGRHTHITGNQ